MKLTTEQLKKFISDIKSSGFDIGLRDISFQLLCRSLEDPVYAYKVAFGDRTDVQYIEYANGDKCAAVASYLDKNYPEEKREEVAIPETDNKPVIQNEGMTYDEIKRGLEEDLQSLIDLRDSKNEDGSSALEPKEMATVVGRIADIRSKLVNQFGTVNTEVEQRVVVMNKFTDICPWCGREIAIDPSHQKLF